MSNPASTFQPSVIPTMSINWPEQIFQELQALNIKQVAYVPDAGHSALIVQCQASPDMRAVSLTTEEEGIAMLAGGWLAGECGVMLMQSSGVGNCINMLSINHECRIPMFALVTMRGEWGEFNPWQVPMGKSTQEALESAGVYVYRADSAEEVAPTVRAAGQMAFNTRRAVAVLIGQRLIGTKNFNK
jgi:sulfopyruvate decarboxylase alpha subunit